MGRHGSLVLPQLVDGLAQCGAAIDPDWRPGDADAALWVSVGPVVELNAEAVGRRAGADGSSLQRLDALAVGKGLTERRGEGSPPDLLRLPVRSTMSSTRMGPGAPLA